MTGVALVLNMTRGLGNSQRDCSSKIGSAVKKIYRKKDRVINAMAINSLLIVSGFSRSDTDLDPVMLTVKTTDPFYYYRLEKNNRLTIASIRNGHLVVWRHFPLSGIIDLDNTKPLATDYRAAKYL